MDNVQQKTLVIIKPDGVQRNLIGEIISRFERVGLKLTEMKMVTVDKEFSGKHYADDPVWEKSVGDKLLKFFEENNQDPVSNIGTNDPVEIGKKVRGWLADYLTTSPVVAMVWEGPHAVEIIRKITGSTYPLSSAPGTIRGDYSFESPFLANVGQRAIENLVHASGSVEEANREIELWFGSKNS